MGANIALGGALATTSETMSEINKIMQPEKIAGDMRNFAQANMKMEMTDEMSMCSWMPQCPNDNLMIWISLQ